MKIHVLVILHCYMIFEYDLKHFYTILVHSSTIPEHFYANLNTFIRSWILLYDLGYFFFEHFSIIKITTPSKNAFQNMGTSRF